MQITFTKTIIFDIKRRFAFGFYASEIATTYGISKSTLARLKNDSLYAAVNYDPAYDAQRYLLIDEYAAIEQARHSSRVLLSDDDINNIFALHNAGHAQADIAKAAGVSRATISRVLNKSE